MQGIHGALNPARSVRYSDSLLVRTQRKVSWPFRRSLRSWFEQKVNGHEFHLRHLYVGMVIQKRGETMTSGRAIWMAGYGAMLMEKGSIGLSVRECIPR